MLADFGMPQMNGSQLVGRLKRISPHVPMILFGDPQKLGGELHAADALLSRKNCSAQELLERIKIMSARKRGPRRAPSAWRPWKNWRLLPELLFERRAAVSGNPDLHCGQYFIFPLNFHKDAEIPALCHPAHSAQFIRFRRPRGSRLRSSRPLLPIRGLPLSLFTGFPNVFRLFDIRS